MRVTVCIAVCVWEGGGRKRERSSNAPEGLGGGEQYSPEANSPVGVGMKQYSLWVNCQVGGEAGGEGGSGGGGNPEVNCPVKRGKQYIVEGELSGRGWWGNLWTNCPVGGDR